MRTYYLWVVIAVSCFLSGQAIAQPPLTINYQAVVRNGQTGLPVSNMPVFLSFEISSVNGGELFYKENHENIQTNEFGLVNVEIGSGQPISGAMSQIRWESGDPWLTVIIDIGNGLEILQEAKFASVPYALFARDVANKDDADADPTNELITDFHFDEEQTSLHLIEAGIERQVDLSTLIDDADSDPTNELIDSLHFNQGNRELIVFEGSNVKSVWLGSIDDADSDPTNELVDSLVLNSGTGLLSLYQNNGQSLSVNFSELDFGGNGTLNGFITGVDFDGSVLTISDNLEAWNADLSQLIDDADNDPTNELITDFHFDDVSKELVIDEGGQAHRVAVSEFAGKEVENFTFNTENKHLMLEQGGVVAFSVDLSSLALDNDPTNELITDFRFDDVSKELVIDEGGQAHRVAVSEFAGKEVENFTFSTENKYLKLYQGGIMAFDVDLSPLALDNDPTNELQDIELNGNDLSLTNSTAKVDLGSYDQSNLTYENIFIGNNEDKAVPVKISGDANLKPDGSMDVVGIQNHAVSNTAPSDGDVLVYVADSGKWVPTPPVEAGMDGSVGYYSIDPSDFVETVRGHQDVSESSYLKLYDKHAPFAYFYKKSGVLVAPVHLPHGATIIEMTVYVRDRENIILNFRLERKELDGFAMTGDPIINTFVSGNFTANKTFTGYPFLFAPKVVKNDKYNYRLRIEGMQSTDDDETDDVEHINQAVYGAVIKYTMN